MNSKQKRLLALDGGGLMGLISLGILAEVEDQLRVATGGDERFRLRDYFDYIGGTSTGGIIAAGLMMGRSVQELRDFYVNNGARMFAKANWFNRIISGFSHKYDPRNLKDMLKKEFTEHTILELQNSGQLPLDKHLLLVMRDHSTDSCWPISTNPAATYNDASRHNCNRKIPLWQFIKASAAAPSFFPPEHVTFSDGSEHTFQDGGLTAHNNPALKLFQMATAPQYQLGWPTGEDALMLLSVGTGLAYDPAKTRPIFGPSLPELAMLTPSNLMRNFSVENDLACRTIGRCTHGVALDREVGTMVVNTPNNTGRLFTYARYEADVSLDVLKALGIDSRGKPLKMDKANQLSAFEEVGENASEQVNIKAHFSNFV